MNDLLTDAQDMANSYKAPCTWLETIVQPQVIAPDGLDESSKGNSLGFGPDHLQDLQQTYHAERDGLLKFVRDFFLRESK